MSSASSTPATADTQRRRKRWSAIAAEKKRTDTGGSDTSETYLQLLVRASQDDADGLIQRQIDKDVRRVPIPVEEPAVLGRVLTAFAARNAEGGYCQGLNFIVSLLLVAVPEEDAFWLLCLLVEDILPPGFYSTELHGSKAEVSVLTQLVARYLPTINPLLARWSLTLEPFVFAWIMCLFVGELPLHLVLDVWDRLLVDGATVLCRASLSLLRIHEPALSAAQSIDDAMLAMQSHRAWAAGALPGSAPMSSPLRPMPSADESGCACSPPPSINGQEVSAEVFNTISFLSALQLYDQVLPDQLDGIRRRALEQLLSSHRSVLLKEAQLQLGKHKRALLKALANDPAHARHHDALGWAPIATRLAELDAELAARVAAIEAGVAGATCGGAEDGAETGAGEKVDTCGGYAVACRLRIHAVKTRKRLDAFIKAATALRDESAPEALPAAGAGAPASAGEAPAAAAAAVVMHYSDMSLKATQRVQNVLVDLIAMLDKQRERLRPLCERQLTQARAAQRHDRTAKLLRSKKWPPNVPAA